MARLGRAQPFSPVIQQRRYLFRPLSGTIDIVSTVEANLNPFRGLSGTVAIVSTVGANLNPFRGLSGTIDIISSVSANLHPFRGLSGRVSVVSSVSANLYVVWALNGTVDIVSYLVASLETIIAEPVRPGSGQATGIEPLMADSRMAEGIMAHGITTIPIPPGRGEGSRTPVASGRVATLPSGLATRQDTPRSGSAGVEEEIEGSASSQYVPTGVGCSTPQPQKGTGKKDRTKEGEAKTTDKPLSSGKAR